MSAHKSYLFQDILRVRKDDPSLAKPPLLAAVLFPWSWTKAWIFEILSYGIQMIVNLSAIVDKLVDSC